MAFKLDDKDLGMTAFLLKQGVKKSVDVGILEDSPREQFRLGVNQEFSPNTAGTLIRGPVDSKQPELEEKLVEAGLSFLFGTTDGTKELNAIGEELAEDMRKQTDEKTWGGGSTRPRSQLSKAIKTKIRDDV